MLSKKSAAQLSIDLVPSKLALVIMVLIHLGAICIIAMLDFNIYLKLLMFSVVIVSFWLCLIKFGWIKVSWRIKPLLQFVEIKRLHWVPEQHIWLLTNNGNNKITARLLPSSYCHSLIVVLNFLVEDMPWYNKRISVVIPFDATNTGAFKQLRVLLRLEPAVIQNNSVA